VEHLLAVVDDFLCEALQALGEDHGEDGFAEIAQFEAVWHGESWALLVFSHKGALVWVLIVVVGLVGGRLGVLWRVHGHWWHIDGQWLINNLRR
jgi:hypothetical protein